MAVTTNLSQKQQEQALRRIWKSPTSLMRWLWLAVSLGIYLVLLGWYILAARGQQPQPINDPFRLFGIFSFVLVLATAAYTLRRRFVRGLPGKVQNWLWMHTWTGIVTILIALLHENFAFVTHDFCANVGCLTDTYWAVSALYALIILVASGLLGRLIDTIYTRVIAQDAATNGVGIAQALEERILELEYTVERFCAGKSKDFKQFCLQALESRSPIEPEEDDFPALPRQEHADFQHAYETLAQRASLVLSLQRQQRARVAMRFWRTVHMVIASLALLIITYHAVMELLVNVFHLITPA